MFKVVQFYRWRCFYADGGIREVSATSEPNAKAVGKAAARLVGCKGQATQVARVIQLGPHGSPRQVWVEQS